MQYRQGDVLIIECDRIPSGLPKRATLIVAIGEATGHAHRFEAVKDVTLFDAADGVMYAKLKRPAALLHDEHAPITLKKGFYKIRRQREFRDEAARFVAD